MKRLKIQVKNLIMPYFVVHGDGIKVPIVSMPGNFRFSVDRLVVEVKEIKKLGIQSVLLFGIPKSKDLFASEACAENGIVQEAIRAIKKSVPGIKVITDICICEYTTHGHCGILKNPNKVEINHKKTLEIYAKMAVSHAAAGADMVAPSGMMKRQVKEIRAALDNNGFKKVRIMGYSAKYASAFYGPFRDAADSAPVFGDRTSYQMNPAGTHAQAMQEIADDIAEGADIVMVKPALAYLDVIREARKKFKKPLAAYNVSGEYSMVKAAAANEWIDGEKVMFEIMTAIQRAGADIIITYHAKEIAGILKDSHK